MKRLVIFSMVLLALMVACAGFAQSSGKAKAVPPVKPAPKYETAIFAGGCFWCMQPPFDATRGVSSTVVGYCGGREKNPTYEQVSNRQTGHRESIEVTYDPAQVTYEQLLDVYWRSFDPTQADGQFADIGPQYRAAIFYRSEDQKRQAEASKQKLAASGKFSKPVVTEIIPAGQFWPAEEYHQMYYKKNPTHYHEYKEGSGRGPFLRRTWGDKHEASGK